MRFLIGAGPVEVDAGSRRGLLRYNAAVYVTREEALLLRQHGEHGLAAVPEGEQFTALDSGDGVKRDLELTCNYCGEVLCDLEPGDDIDTWARRVTAHQCLRTPAGDVLTWKEIEEAWGTWCCPVPCTCEGRAVTGPHTDPACPWYGTDTP